MEEKDQEALWGQGPCLTCVGITRTSGFLGSTNGKEPSCQGRRHNKTRVQSLGREDPLEEGMAIHSGILAWRIAWTEELCGVYSRVSQRVGHD